MNTLLEVLNIICMSSIVHTKIVFVPREQRLENRESLPFLPHYHLCPWTCNILDSPWMPLSSGSAISFISITTHFNNEKYARSICFGCHSDTPNRSLPIRSSRGQMGRRVGRQGDWITMSPNAQLVMQGLKSWTRSMSFWIKGSDVWGGIYN